MKNPKLAALFLRAAEIMDDPRHGFGSCNALCRAMEGLRPGESSLYAELPEGFGEVQNRYEAVFRDDGCASTYWWAYPPEGRAERVLALCFAAAMAATGDM